MASRVEFVLTDSHQEAFIGAKKNGFDLIPIQQLEAGLPAGYSLYSYDYMQSLILYMNTKSKRFKNRKNRCGLAREFIGAAKKSGYNWDSLTTSIPFARGLFEFTPNNYKFGFKGKVTIHIADSVAIFMDRFNRNITQSIVNSGLTVEFKRHSVRELVRLMRAGEIEIGLLGYAPDYIDPDAFLSPSIRGGQQYNFFNYKNAEIDDLLLAARAAERHNERNIIYRRVFRILSRECPVGFLGVGNGLIVKSNKIKELVVSGLGFHTLKISDVRL